MKNAKVPVPLTDEQYSAFKTLIDKLLERVMMHYVEPGYPFILDSDVSDRSIGACLSQEVNGEERPLTFASKVLGLTRQSYCTTKRELFAIIYEIFPRLYKVL